MMYNITSDMHTHTLVSSHAFNTLNENIEIAKLKRLCAIAKTEHGPKMIDAPHEWHFGGLMDTVPEYIHGIRIFRGVEANIMNADGILDVSENLLRKYEWVIASYHSPTFTGDSIEAHTQGWLSVADNPYVDCIGHCGTEANKFEYEKVIKVFAEKNKIVELNNHSYEVRRGAPENCREIAKLCKKHGVQVVITSDAHSSVQIGTFRYILSMLDEITFPKELILNEGDFSKIELYIDGKQKINRR